MTVFEHGGVFFGSNTLWVNMVVKAYNPPKPLGIVIPKYTGKGDKYNIIFTST